MGPYSTCESEAILVVHVMVALTAVILEELTFDMTGAALGAEVVPKPAVDWAELLPTASYAETVYEYVVDGVSPVS